MGILIVLAACMQPLTPTHPPNTRPHPPNSRDALDAALATKQPGVVDALLEEFAARGALPAALAGRDAAGLIPLLRHLAKYVADPRHTATLAGVAARVVDMYSPVVATDARVGGSGAAFPF